MANNAAAIAVSEQQGIASARQAGLRYAHDSEPGIGRRRRGATFIYRDDRGRPVDAATKARIRALVIPPAWTDVWIAADAHAHLQVTGRDARGRKQYRYHPDWSAVRDAAKYDHLRDFARALPAIRRRVASDLRAKALSRPWVLATVTRVLEESVIRIGNDEYRRTNGSYGLTTLLDRHVETTGGTLTLKFIAKSGVKQEIAITNAMLARHVRQCQDLPGQTLFQYRDDEGALHTIGSSDVNAYVQEASGGAFTAKDFRTWVGTLTAARALDADDCRAASSIAARNRAVVRALDEVASKLGNTRAVCRKCYVHPVIIDHYLQGRTLSAARRRRIDGLRPDEYALLSLLEVAALTPARRARAR